MCWTRTSVCAIGVFRFVVQAEDGIRDLVLSRGLGDVYKRQAEKDPQRHAVETIPHPLGHRQRFELLADAPETLAEEHHPEKDAGGRGQGDGPERRVPVGPCLLYTSDAAARRSSVDLGGGRIIKNKNNWLRGREGR